MQTTMPVGRRQALAHASYRMKLLPALRSLYEMVSNRDLRVLAYHRVLEAIEPPEFDFDVDLISASADAFRMQMLHVRQDYAPMRFDEVAECIGRGRRLPKKAVLVTFDDGYDDNHRVAFPILRDLGMSAMFFVSTGHIDSGGPYAYDWLVHMLCRSPGKRLRLSELGLDWVMGNSLAERRGQAVELLGRIKALDADTQSALILRLEAEWGMPRTSASQYCRPMTWEQLREMRAAGMEVGSHGVHHSMLSKLPHDRMVAEVVESRRALHRELGGEAIALSYPVGGPDAYDARTIEAVRDAGYLVACSYTSGVAAIGRTDPYAIPRLAVEREMGQAWFEAMLAAPGLFAYSSKRRMG